MCVFCSPWRDSSCRRSPRWPRVGPCPRRGPPLIVSRSSTAHRSTCGEASWSDLNRVFICYLWRHAVGTKISTAAPSEWDQFSEMDETKKLSDRTGEGRQGLLTSFAAFYRRWIVLEPTIFLFLVSGRMVYFTRANLFIDVSRFICICVCQEGLQQTSQSVH